MPANALRTPARLFAVSVLLSILTCCGSNTPIICNAPSSNSNTATCTCGSGTDACAPTHGPEFLYATAITSTGGQILAFSVDRNSGALTSIGSVPGPSNPFPTVGLAAVNNQFLFASDRSQSQLDGYSIDQTTGALSAIAGSPFSTGTLSFPGALVSPPFSNFLYASDIAMIDAFDVSSAGAPSAISGSPFPSGSGLFLATGPTGGFVYAPDADPPGGVRAFAIGSSGALTEVPGSPFTIPGQPDSVPTGIADDNGSFVYTTLPLTNQIAAFSIVSGTGALTPVPGSPFAAGNGPTSVIVTANGFLYALNTGSISGYSINSDSGVLTPLSGSPFATAGLSIATNFLGQYLYVAGPIGIQVFTINPSSGALTPLPGSPFVASGATFLTIVQIPPP